MNMKSFLTFTAEEDLKAGDLCFINPDTGKLRRHDHHKHLSYVVVLTDVKKGGKYKVPIEMGKT